MINHMVEYNVSLDNIFRALSDPTRRSMLTRLKARQHTILELAEPYSMSLTAVSKHLKVLEAAGLLKFRREGRSRICTLNAEPLAEAEHWLSTYATFWNTRLDALEAELKKDSDHDLD